MNKVQNENVIWNIRDFLLYGKCMKVKHVAEFTVLFTFIKMYRQ